MQVASVKILDLLSPGFGLRAHVVGAKPCRGPMRRGSKKNHLALSCETSRCSEVVCFTFGMGMSSSALTVVFGWSNGWLFD